MNKKYLLNFGLAFVFLFAGISSFLRPYDWVGFVPMWVVKFGVSQMAALHIHAVVEILLGLLLLGNIKTKWVGLIAALDLAAIIVVNGFGAGILLITFRDVGLVFMALYLAAA